MKVAIKLFPKYATLLDKKEGLGTSPPYADVRQVSL